MVKKTTSAGFEPTRAKPSRFRICRLNLSAKMPQHISSCSRGLVGYDDRLTRDRSRVRFSVGVVFFFCYKVAVPIHIKNKNTNSRKKSD